MAKRLAIVTGGRSGIGGATARALCYEQDVLTVSRRPIVGEDGSSPSSLHHLQADLSRPDQAVGTIIKWLRSRSEFRVNLLVSAAAEIALGPLGGATVARAEEVFRTNAWAPVTLTHSLVQEDFMERNHARCIYLTSSLARNGSALSFAQIGLYSATKAALERLVQVQQREFALGGITVNATLVHPGIVATAMQEILRGDPNADPAFIDKTAKLPRYQENDWTHSRPSENPRTISAEDAAEFIVWISRIESDKLQKYYDFYTCEKFHKEVVNNGR